MSEGSKKGCLLCPRECGADRELSSGVCSVPPGGIMVARASLHMWEEPCISGERGSGTIFFSGCPLRCVYCQNREISRGEAGKMIDGERLSEIMLSLEERGAHNINMVTPTHYTDRIITAVKLARDRGLSVPIVWNTSGYERVDTLKKLEGTADIYLTDFKYMSPLMAKRYSSAEDYPSVAAAALREMVSQQGRIVCDDDGMMQRGVIVRHLVLPGCVEDSKAVIGHVYSTYGDSVILSLMSQYTPMEGLEDFPELQRKLTPEEYDEVVDYAADMGVENAFIQEGEAASESFIPPFDLEGV
ncbi:MAG: radical SAM protein [Eubacteriaceae bacterium]|nr:radical SAM protein [Eubacteriaceae bacterium]